MSISSDEINYLIYRYLQENGFTHTAFSFAYESLVTKSSVSQTEIPPGNSSGVYICKSIVNYLRHGKLHTLISEFYLNT